MQSSMLLSVIVPVYNAGEYLLPCIESLIALPVEKEIIVVDDGSTDGAVERLAERNFVDVKVYRQENHGVSAARNEGMKHACGEWLWFVDADDSVEQPVLPFDWSEVPDQVKLLTLPYVWEQDGTATHYAAQDDDVPYNLWRCMFRRQAIERHNLRFTLGRRYAEDQEFILHYLLAEAGEIRSAIAPTYHYTMRATGAMKKKDTRGRQRRDVTCVLLGFVGRALCRGKLMEPWVQGQIKRLLKTISVI